MKKLIWYTSVVCLGLSLMSCSSGNRKIASQEQNGGDKGGNGGDAVVCRNNAGEIIKAELLDYYEGRTMRGLNVSAELSLDEPEVSIPISRL
jgi:hypothetical protein